MKLENISENFIKKFSGATIFSRGKEYHQSQMVEEIEYDSTREHIQAEVSGSSGSSYDVEITAAKSGVDAMCSCPFEGYPCKHIVAVLLTFLKKKEILLCEAVENHKKMSSLKERVDSLSKDRLIEVLFSLTDKYPDCRRDLLIHLGDDQKEIVSIMIKQIHQLFRAFESDDHASSKVVKQLNGILKSIEKSSIQIKIKIYWAVADRILKELNEYGMNDEPLEDVVIETLDLLVEIFSKSEAQEKKAGIIQALKKYSAWGNCGIIDSIDEAIGRLDSQNRG